MDVLLEFAGDKETVPAESLLRSWILFSFCNLNEVTEFEKRLSFFGGRVCGVLTAAGFFYWVSESTLLFTGGPLYHTFKRVLDSLQNNTQDFY